MNGNNYRQRCCGTLRESGANRSLLCYDKIVNWKTQKTLEFHRCFKIDYYGKR